MTLINKLRIAKKIIFNFGHYRSGANPFFVSYQITHHCNKMCVFCNAWKDHTPELTTKEAKKVVSEIASSNTVVLGITGGEPLMRPDLEEIGVYAKRKGLYIGLNTNGTLLTSERANSIARVFDTVFVSLDGFEKTHDKLRGQPETFRQAIRGLRNLLAVKGNCLIGVNFVLNRDNYREFERFYHWIRQEFGVLVTAFPVGGYGEYMAIPEKHIDGFTSNLLTLQKASSRLGPSERVLGLIPSFVKGQMKHLCDAGHLYFGVNPTGNLLICPLMPSNEKWEVGSLISSSMHELVCSNRFQQVLANTKQCKGCLAGCTTPYSLLFNGSISNLIKEGISNLKTVF